MPIYNNEILMDALYDANRAFNACTDEELSHTVRKPYLTNAIVHYTNFLTELLQIAARISTDRPNAIHSINYLLHNRENIQGRIARLELLSGEFERQEEPVIQEALFTLNARWQQCLQMTTNIHTLEIPEIHSIHENITRPYAQLLRRQRAGQILQRAALNALTDRLIIHLDLLQQKLRFNHTQGTYEETMREDFDVLSEYIINNILPWLNTANLTSKATELQEAYRVFTGMRQMQEGFRILQEEGIVHKLNSIHLERQAPLYAQIERRFNRMRTQLQKRLQDLLNEVYQAGRNLLQGIFHPVEALRRTWDVVTHPMESLNAFIQYCWEHPGRAALYIVGSLAIIGAGAWAGAALIPALGIAATISEAAVTATIAAVVVGSAVAAVAVLPAGSEGRKAIKDIGTLLTAVNADEKQAREEQKNRYIHEQVLEATRRAGDEYDRMQREMEETNAQYLEQQRNPEAIENNLALLERDQLELRRLQTENNANLATALATIRGRDRDISEAERGMLAMQRLSGDYARAARPTTGAAVTQQQAANESELDDSQTIAWRTAQASAASSSSSSFRSNPFTQFAQPPVPPSSAAADTSSQQNTYSSSSSKKTS